MKEVNPLAETTLIPQFLFDVLVRQVHDLNGKAKAPYWQIQTEVLQTQVNKMKKVLTLLPQEKGTIIVWVMLEDTITYKNVQSIQTNLEHQLERLVKGEWDILVELIPVREPYIVEEISANIEMLIHRLSVQFPFETFGQIVGFGHPVVSQALFLESVNHFGERYHSIYFDDKEIISVPTFMSDHKQSVTNHLKNFILEYDYIGASDLAKDLKDKMDIQSIEMLIQMMRHRMNFSFEEALTLLKEVENNIGDRDVLSQTKVHLMNLISNRKQKRDLARIDELFRQINSYLEIDDLPSFLVRFYRVREAVLFYLLEHAQTEPSPVKHVKRTSIYQVFEELEEKYDCWEIDGYYGTYFWLKSSNVAKVLEERNKSFIGHTRNGIDKNQLWHSYYGSTHTTIEKSKRRFKMDTSLMLRELGIKEENTFERINKLIIELITKAEKKGAVVANG